MLMSHPKKTITLSVTHACNLNCCYCYEMHKDNKIINIATGKQIIYDELHKTDFSHVEFSFFGGEPFIAFDAIREFYEYAKTVETKASMVTFSAITNGTMLTDSMKNWLRLHNHDFLVTLSIDGTKTMHDLNRNSSFDLIDVDFFINTYKPAYAKMTVSNLTLSNLAEGMIYLTEKGFKVACNLAYGLQWKEHDFNVLREQLKILEDYCIQNYPDKELCSLMEFPYMEIYQATRNDTIYSCCSAGRETCAYDIDGVKYPCHMFFPSNRECACDVSDLNFSESGVVCKDLLPQKCRNCPIVMVCQQCYGSNWLLNKDIYDVNNDICTINKISFKAKAELAAKLWNDNKLQLDGQHELALIKSVMSVANMV